MIVFHQRGEKPLTDEAYAAFVPLDRALSQLLYARGVSDAAQAETFLNPSPDHLHDPMLMGGMAQALSILQKAKECGTRVIVYGDYDVDGICASAIMTLALRQYGLQVDYAVPLRQEGYGLNMVSVEKLAAEYGLLVTVDLGISNVDEVARARELGMQVIVTDHHQLPTRLCKADAIVHPLLMDYPCPMLCGAGVAFKLAQALLGLEQAMQYIDLSALATIADMVPLLDENRVIVKIGLERLAGGDRPGLSALIAVSGLSGKLNTGHVGFQLAPRLNAAGRLKDARIGVELLLSQSAEEAIGLAKALDEANVERKKVEQAMLLQAQEQAAGYDYIENPVLIVTGEGWHAGVIGLVAGRLCQQYACPVMALCADGNELHGSLRSVRGVHIQRMLTLCDDLLERYGGHEMAAGLTVKKENFAALCERLNAVVREHADPDAFLPSQEYDLSLPLEALDKQLLLRLEQLAPYGIGNPAPLLLSSGLGVQRRRACGASGAHLQLTLRGGNAMLDGIAFGQGALERELEDTVDCVYALKQNEYMGRVSLQLDIKALRAASDAGLHQLSQLHSEDDSLALIDLLAAMKPNEDEKAGNKAPDNEVILNTDGALPKVQRGTLFVARTQVTASAFLRDWGQSVDLCLHKTSDPRCFPTLLVYPNRQAAKGHWRQIVLLDGAVAQGEISMWRSCYESARIVVCPLSQALRELARELDSTDEMLRELYKKLRRQSYPSLSALAQDAQLSPMKALCALTAFSELGLLRLSRSPFLVAMLPMNKCRLDDSPTLDAIRRLALGKEAF